MPNLRQVFSRSFVLRPTLRPIDFLISDCDVESVNWGHSDFRTPLHNFMQALSRLSFLRSFVLVGRTAQGRAGQVQKERMKHVNTTKKIPQESLPRTALS